MGLAIIHGIVKSRGGSLSYRSVAGSGTVFHVLLPIVDEPACCDAPSTGVADQGSEHILLIDDEEMLVEMGCHMLERLGYRVTTRQSSIEALTTFQNQPQSFDLVITDQTMPFMTGSDLARRMLQIRPDLPIILCTGYSSIISAEKAQSLGIRGFALKPLVKKDIGRLIRDVLDGKKTSSTTDESGRMPTQT
jgi:CheY-like chemotaxis protein